ncbi:MAG: LysE family transporter [Saprospiraceae bacterium]|nr:LysE family transporter [Saprospiraceae bacterium]
MHSFWYFMMAFGISLLGSLPFGMINLNVLATAVHRGPRPALLMGLGATLVEGIQILIVLFGFGFLATHTKLESILQWVAVPVFLGLAWYYYTAKPPQKEGEVVQRQPFWRGVGLSLINVLVYPFWFLWLGIMAFPVEERSIWAWLITGAVMGAFASMVIFTFLGRVIEKKSEKVTRHLNRIIAIVFLGLALWQLVRMI